MSSALWWRDFEFEDGVITVKKTGARLPLEPGLIGEVLSWFPFYFIMEAWRLKKPSQNGPKIWFAPDRPRPWYLIWSVMHAAGARIAGDASQADAIFFFDDSTTCHDCALPPGKKVINRDCRSIEKSHVTQVFEKCFGYQLGVDPETWQGAMVEKSEMNGAHDGRVVHGPCRRQPGKVYQRVIDNSRPGGLVEDLRCAMLGGKVPLVIRKRRRISDRFSNSNCEVELADTDTVLSKTEQDQLARFAAEMKLDWGGVDVLRDRNDNRLYVVDVNKTDLGPPIAMALDDKIEMIKRMAPAFLTYLDSLKESEARALENLSA